MNKKINGHSISIEDVGKNDPAGNASFQDSRWIQVFIDCDREESCKELTYQLTKQAIMFNMREKTENEIKEELFAYIENDLSKNLEAYLAADETKKIIRITQNIIKNYLETKKR